MNKKDKGENNIRIKKEPGYSTDELDIDIGTIKVELGIKPEIFQSTDSKEEFVKKHNASTNIKKKKKNTQRNTKKAQKNLKKILNVSDDEVTYFCETCNKFFPTWNQLKNHAKNHKKKENGPFSCAKCEKSFSYKCNLERHMDLHDATKRFSCTYCDKKFKRNYMLQAHVRSHKGIRPYSCEKCQLEFTTKGSLIQHNEVHSKKTFKCSICGQLFRRKFNMIQHERSHRNEKPYTCIECNRKFTYKSNMKTHQCLSED